MVMSETPIYMITGYELHGNKLGDKVNWGFYYSFEEAEKIVLNNWTDLYEGCYNIMIIEELLPGIINNSKKISFYQWNNNFKCYEFINRPEIFKRSCCFFC